MKTISSSAVRRWYRIHKWTSLICTIVLLMSCLTGLPMIFNEEISALIDPPAQTAQVPKDAPMVNLDQIVSSAQGRYPHQKVLSLALEDDAPRIFVVLGPSYVARPATRHAIIFDAHTGALLEEPKATRSFMTYINLLHTQLFAGVPGGLFLGVMALLFIVALISGAVVYGPFMHRLDFGTVRRGRTRRTHWFDMHNLLGIVTLSWACVVGGTGLINTLSTPLFGLWRIQTLPHLLAPYHGRPVPQHFSSINAAFYVARDAMPGREITGVILPDPVNASPRHYVFFAKGETPVTSRLFNVALVDVETGKLTISAGLPWYLRTLEVSRPLHFGDYGGLPLKIIWALFDVALITVLLSGVYLWLSRRKTPVEAELDRLVKLEALAAEKTPLAGVLAK